MIVPTVILYSSIILVYTGTCYLFFYSGTVDDAYTHTININTNTVVL